MKIIFRAIIYPISSYLINLKTIIGLRLGYPTLKVAPRVKVRGTSLGKYNALGLDATVINSKMSDYSYVGKDSFIFNCTIGKFTCIGPSAKIGLGKHPVKKFASIHPIFYSLEKQVGITFADKQYFEEYDEQTYIGNDVWIGANVIIPGGVTIGDGAVIASGSVIASDVPSYAIVGGIPAKVIKYRFEEDKIRILKELLWWDRDVNWLKANLHNFHDIDKFTV